MIDETASATKTDTYLERNARYIPGGLFSLNRRIAPMRVFERAQGAYLWDVEGRRYIDYHAAFAPYFLGHADPDVDGAVIEAIRANASLFGAGSAPWEGELAELLVESVPTLERVQVTNTGSEATAYAIRLARAVTGRDGVLLMQGGYNGWEDDVAFNLMDAPDEQRPREDDVGLALHPITNGIPAVVRKNTFVVQFNDLDAVEEVLRTGRVAAVMLEPVLQNVGIVKPLPGYLEGLRRLCDEHGTLLVFDEVKTGFRNGLGGYQALCGVTPDLSTFGKAVANGYPLGVIGGKERFMRYFDHADPRERVLIAGTYNGHPVPVAAAIATLKKLRDRGGEIYSHTDDLGEMMEEGLRSVFAGADYAVTIVRQRSAFVTYFMDHAPLSWLDVSRSHDMERDRRYRAALIDAGVFHFPTPGKQGSISFAHTRDDIAATLEITERVVRAGV
jgi:glutamate-1-semialdehyde 2,1-aminomutase